MIKVNSKMQLVDINNPSVERVVGSLFRDVDERIYWRKNALVETLTEDEKVQINNILEEYNYD